MGDRATTADAELVRRAKGGDSEAFGQLVTRHEGAMMGVARAFFRCEPDARDAVQEAFVKAFESLRDLREDERFAGWLGSITRRTCVDVLRSRTDKVSLAEFSSTVELRPLQGQEHLTPSTLSSNNEHADLLLAAIGRLTEDQRLAVMLRYVENMTYKRMAEYLGVDPSTIRGRLQHAKALLRNLLGHLFEFDD